MSNLIGDPNNPKIMIIGGHMTPALAVVDELNKQGYLNLVWVGHAHSQIGNTNLSPEYKIITSRNIPFIDLKTGKLYRTWNLSTFKNALSALINIPFGIFRARKILKTQSPSLIFAFGGYIAVPIAICAYFLKIPIVTHEQTIVSGLANRIIGKYCNKIFISWKENEKVFPPLKTIFTGNPIRNAIFKIQSQNINFYNKLPIIAITGGNQGSQIINETITKLLPTLLNEFNVVHQTGNSSITQDYEKAVAFKANLPDHLVDRYFPKEFFGENEIGELFNKSSLFISRSGLNFVTEYMALNKSCILIPIPNSSGDEQLMNARHLEKLGLAKTIQQKDLTPEILNKKIFEIVDERSRGKNTKGELWNQTLVQTRIYVKKDAAEKIVNESLSLLKIDV
jgi:UDP-N-acetylglucosamine--N-acetylmuramyl-(pentapeptide) pyrophosphoryl-undecaprenol N-acetylglucosamine transferase